MEFDLLVMVLKALKDLIEGYHEYFLAPSKEKKEKLEEHIQNLETIYLQFELKVHKAELELNGQNLLQFKEQFKEYGSTLDELFVRIIGEGKRIIKDTNEAKSIELQEYAQKLLKVNSELQELWINLTEAVIMNNPKHVRHYFKHVILKIDEYVQSSIQLGKNSIDYFENKRLFDSLKYRRFREYKSSRRIENKSPSEISTRSDSANSETFREEQKAKNSDRQIGNRNEKSDSS